MNLVLEGVYLKTMDRLDSRGNKEGVNAQFSLEKEILAFPVRSELGEVDGKTIFTNPNSNVILALERSKTLTELEKNLPTEI